ncbi:hypothetical protein KIT90_27505 [Vibrio sp. B172a]|uniref:transposase n=1 Tax=Vibrio sp. B172a TaxID=2835790 RepID=UPI002555F8BF|nr:transposase [Vibrio sp. B172a]MDK9785128.1 hypothetical protein [Vibrio sp. B172a]
MTPIEANIHRDIIGKTKSITVSLNKTGEFYASILINDGKDAPALEHTVKTVTGIDLGLFHFVVESNDRKIANPRFVQRVEKTANARADFQHQLSRTLADENQAVVVETLKSANMMKNRKLAKHIADAS